MKLIVCFEGRTRGAIGIFYAIRTTVDVDITTSDRLIKLSRTQEELDNKHKVIAAIAEQGFELNHIISAFRIG